MKKLHPVAKDAVITGILGLVAILTSIGAGWIVLAPDRSPNVIQPATRSDAEEVTFVRGKEILDSSSYKKDEKDYVDFTYVGERTPERLSEKEVVAARTAISFTEDLGTVSGKNEKILHTITYPRPQFTERSDGWHYIEYGTVLKKNFDKAQSSSPLGAILNVAHAASATIFTGSGDGFAYVGPSALAWATIVSAAGGDGANDTDATSGASAYAYVETFNCGTEKDPVPCNGYQIVRGYLPFDTSSIPAGATITAASLNVTVSGSYDGSNDGLDYVTVVQTSQATHTTVAASDYDNVGSTEAIDSGQRKDTTGVSVDALLTYTLNATGIGFVKKAGQSSACSATTGITCLGVRDGHDMQNTAPADGTLTTGFTFYGSEQTGTSQDPYLSITYTVPFAFWQFQDF